MLFISILVVPFVLMFGALGELSSDLRALRLLLMKGIA
jgi:hypothetical protein